MLTKMSLSLFIAKFLQYVLNFALLALAIILLCFLAKESFALVDALFINSQELSNYLLMEGIIIYFLYFEFTALVVKYFQTKNHFPLRYFIYIGITAIIRLIIVDHANPKAVLLYSLAILVLIVALYLASSNRLADE